MARRTGVSKNTIPVWCAVCAGSPPHALSPSESAGSGPPPSGTTQEASAASQSASGSLQRGRSSKGKRDEAFQMSLHMYTDVKGGGDGDNLNVKTGRIIKEETS